MPQHYVPKGIHTGNMPLPQWREPVQTVVPVRPFVVIAQQPGAECAALAQRLGQALSGRDADGPAWSYWGEELIARISAETHVPKRVIESLEASSHSWFDDLLEGISGHTDELAIVNRLKKAVRNLAIQGHTILVGHGLHCMTRDMPGGLHVQLIAPLEVRTQKIATRCGLSRREARRELRRIERQQTSFFKRFLWPACGTGPETFDAIFNVKPLEEERIARAILTLLPRRAKWSRTNPENAGFTAETQRTQRNTEDLQECELCKVRGAVEPNSPRSAIV